MSTPDPLTTQGAPAAFQLPMMQAMMGQPADPASRFDQMFSMVLQMYTQNAVTQTTLGNLDRRMGAIEHGFDARLKELETARYAELTQYGALRADMAANAGRAQYNALNGDNNLMTQQQNRAAQFQSTLITVAVSVIVPLLVLLLSGNIHH